VDRVAGTVRNILTVAAMAAGMAVLDGPVAFAASNQAVTSCSLTPIYSAYEDGQLSGPRYYYPHETALTVVDGNGAAWSVVVNRNGDSGWMDADCVSFLA
jgi:hypothetical protein